jgi:hypothetical protein
MDKIALVKAVSSRLIVALVAILGLLLVFFVGFMFFGDGLTLPVVMLLGALGAFISLQRRFKDLDEGDLMLIRDSVPYTFLAPLAGATLAGVLYLAFLSGILAGEIFPDFKIEDNSGAFGGLFTANSSNPADYAKLLFWSFVAGFSEKFVTNIIGSFEQR